MFRAIIYLASIVLIFPACKQGGSGPDASEVSTIEDDNSVIQTRNTLEGTWQLMAAKLAHRGEGESDSFTNESDVIALKIFTRNRFAVIRYHKETSTLLGTGGGTYIQLGDEFTEYIDYHSWDSTLVNYPQNFTCTFEGDLFTNAA